MATVDKSSGSITDWLTQGRAKPNPNARPPAEPPDGGNWRLWLPFWVAGAGLSSIVLLSLGYALTRPCTIGPCRAISRAQQLSQRAIGTLDEQRSTPSLISAQQQLAEAKAVLHPIPKWSPHHKTAQDLRVLYQNQTEMLDQAAAALKPGSIAAEKSQNPPHPSERWQEIQELWEAAIVQLEAIVPSSPAYGFSQKKLAEYQGNLATIEQRLDLEESAQEQLEAAQSAVEVARARQSVAQGLEAWQLVDASWQTARSALRRVPEGTMAGLEAEQLFTVYETQWLKVRDRRRQEQIAANFYERALQLADGAKLFQEQRKWNQALAQWQQALSHAQQVPEGTSYSPQAQALATSYTQAMEKALEGQEMEVSIQQARRELKQICTSGSTSVCEYRVSHDAIKVQILPGYIDYIHRLTRNSDEKGDFEARTRIEEHKQALIQSLATISDRAKIPIELYKKSDGSLIGSHQPGG